MSVNDNIQGIKRGESNFGSFGEASFFYRNL